LKPLVYNLAKASVIELKQNFNGVSRHAGIKDFLIPVDDDVYRSAIETAQALMIDSNNVLAKDDPETADQMLTNRYFNAASYRTPMIITDVEGSAAWLLANVKLARDVERDLSRLDRALNGLSKVCEAVRSFAVRNPNAQALYPRMRAHVEAYQRDIQFLTRLVAATRFTVRDGAMFFKLLTAGESVVLGYINSLNKPETEPALKEIVTKNRKKHEEILRRFKAYIN